MEALRRSYAIEMFRIGTMINGSDIQQLYLWMIWPGDKVLHIVSHQEKLHLCLGSVGFEKIGLSCVCLLQCIQMSTEFHHTKPLYQRM